MIYSYKSVILFIPQEKYEIISALLSESGIESFYETEEALIGYYSDKIDEKLLLANLKELEKSHNIHYKIEEIENVNWNSKWEEDFTPIEVNKFVRIRADFHPTSADFKHEITINPKMAFGTGHHETTYMMIAAMEEINFEKKLVLDLGCGTSVLAILADQLGGDKIVAIDNDPNSVSNSHENIKSNNAERVDVKEGTISDARFMSLYDIILANINRSVLLSCAEEINQNLKSGGQLLLSGILNVDMDLVTSAYEDLGFTVVKSYERGEWICILLNSRRPS